LSRDADAHFAHKLTLDVVVVVAFVAIVFAVG
jgi:hypothetical protein